MTPCTLVYAASVQTHKRYVFANLKFCSQARLSSDQMDVFMQEFVDSVKEVFPQLFVQFEDFSTDNAFRYLDMFRSRYRVFNDDVKSILCSFGINLVSDISYVTRYKGQVKSICTRSQGRLITYHFRRCCSLWFHQRCENFFKGCWYSSRGPADSFLWCWVCWHRCRQTASIVFHLLRPIRGRGEKQNICKYFLFM